MKHRTLAALLCLSLGASLFAQTKKLTVTGDIQAGDTIAGERTFVVKADTSETQINQIEFYVNGELRDTKGSTPYTFTLDTLSEEEGPIDLEFRAYGTKGETGSLKAKVKINNQLDKGPEFHNDKAKEFVTNAKFQDAVVEARTAIKADKSFLPAKYTLSTAYFALGLYDKAQKFAEDVTSADPKNAAAYDLESGIALKRAFLIKPGQDASSAIESANASFATAIDAHVKAGEARLAAMEPVTDANRLAYIDLALKYHRYATVAALGNKEFYRKPGTALGNRLAFAYIRRGQFHEASKVIESIGRFDKPNSYTYCLDAVIAAMAGDSAQATQFLTLASQGEGAEVLAQTRLFCELYAKKSTQFDDLVKQLVSVNERSPVTQYYQVLQARRAGDEPLFQRLFKDAVQADPGLADLYVERGLGDVYSAATSKITDENKKTYFGAAMGLFQAGMTASPDSPYALSAAAMGYLAQQDFANAASFANAAATTGPDYAGAAYVFAAIMRDGLATSQQIRSDPAKQKEWEKRQMMLLSTRQFPGGDVAEKAFVAASHAGDADRFLAGKGAPSMKNALAYLLIRGRLPVLSPPKN